MVRLGAPVVLGQTKAGLAIAAVAILGWQLSGTARAQVPAQGSSENDYFRLEWEYDLTGGTALYRFVLSDDLDQDKDSLWLFGQFDADGRAMDLLSRDSNSQWYDDSGSFPASAFGFLPTGDYGMKALLGRYQGATAEVRVAFDPTDVELVQSEFEYCGALSASIPMGAPSHTDFSDSMEFVTIQTIPEPNTIALLGLGAAGAAFGRRREDEKDNTEGR